MRVYLVIEVGTTKPPLARRTYRAAAALARRMTRAEGRVELRGAVVGYLRVLGRAGGSGVPITVDVQPVEVR